MNLHWSMQGVNLTSGFKQTQDPYFLSLTFCFLNFYVKFYWLRDYFQTITDFTTIAPSVVRGHVHAIKMMTLSRNEVVFDSFTAINMS